MDFEKYTQGYFLRKGVGGVGGLLLKDVKLMVGDKDLRTVYVLVFFVTADKPWQRVEHFLT